MKNRNKMVNFSKNLVFEKCYKPRENFYLDFKFFRDNLNFVHILKHCLFNAGRFNNL